jgi:23S rRNA (uracil1939-C5)-methyltransferase
MRNNKNRIVEIEIVSLSKKGNGLGFFAQPNGTTMQAEIPFTLPGDKVRALLMRKRGDLFSGKLEEVITPSSQRIPPKCVHFGVCGGCRLQHTSYENQLQHKENHVRKCFSNLDKHESDIRPIFPCSNPWNYRNKMEYSFSSDLAGKKYLGLSMDSSNGKVFNMVECHLTHPWFIEALKSVKQWWDESGLDAYHGTRDAGSLRNLTLREGRRTGDRMAVLTVSGNPSFALRKHHLDSFVAFVRDAVEPINPDSKLSIFLRIQQIGKGMPTNIYEMLLYGPDHIREILHLKVEADKEPFSLTFHVSPSAFFQTNTAQAEQLYSLALSMAKIPDNATVYDLYCGTGVLGICISKQAKKVVGIELSPESALDARTNAKLNGCNNVTIISGAVRNVLSQMPEKNIPHPDVIIVNPPRPGLDPEAMKHLIEFNAPKILYISCNSITQAVDVAGLLPHGYYIESIQPIDQFPQTYHVENIVVLTKIK